MVQIISGKYINNIIQHKFQIAMRKLSFGLIAILTAITGFTSCSQESEFNTMTPEAKTTNNKVTVEEAKINVP